MKSTSDPVLNLVQAMNRARDSGLTDDDTTRKATWFALLDRLKDVLDEAHSENDVERDSGKKLATNDILDILATLSGWYVGAYTDNPLGEFVTMLKFSTNMTETMLYIKKAKKEL